MTELSDSECLEDEDKECSGYVTCNNRIICSGGWCKVHRGYLSNKLCGTRCGVDNRIQQVVQ
jgi:hypothetical protein